MTLAEKLTILTDAAKYDVACTSSGGDRRGGRLGKTIAAGCCHSFSADGRCISLLKLLLTNVCVYDCQYCVNRTSNDLPRAMFTPRELADLTIDFYRRNYIEGLFLSSAVVRSPDYTTELMIRTLTLLREDYGFSGYIHAKAIPGADPLLTARLGRLADRLSVNIELPSSKSLALLAPDKKTDAIFQPMAQIKQEILQSKAERQKFRHAPAFAPAGQSTQMIVGASDETDYHILKLSEGMYRKYGLKRVFFSAYVPVTHSPLLPSPLSFRPPLLREHRLYQSDWLLRFYHFQADELLSPDHPTLNPQLDPKCSWAMSHLEYFPVEVNTADYPGHRGGQCPADSLRPAVAVFGSHRPGQAGGGSEAGPVFHHLLRQNDPRPPGYPGRSPAGPDPPGGPRSARALRTALPFPRLKGGSDVHLAPMRDAV